MNKILVLVFLSMTFSGCFIGASFPHGQKPGLIVGVNIR